MPTQRSWTRRSRATRSRRPRSRRAPEAAKRYHLFLFLDIRGMLSSNDDVSFACSGMSLELSRSRTMSRRRSPRRAPRRPRVRSSNGWRSRRTSRRRRRRKRNQNYLLFVFLDATASRIYFIIERRPCGAIKSMIWGRGPGSTPSRNYSTVHMFVIFRLTRFSHSAQ